MNQSMNACFAEFIFIFNIAYPQVSRNISIHPLQQAAYISDLAATKLLQYRSSITIAQTKSNLALEFFQAIQSLYEEALLLADKAYIESTNQSALTRKVELLCNLGKAKQFFGYNNEALTAFDQVIILLVIYLYLLI